MKPLNKVISTVIAITWTQTKRLYLKLRLWIAKKQRNKAQQSVAKYQARLPYGKEDIEDYWE